MPRRPTLSCASCAKPMWTGRGARPQGEARCRECRSTQLSHGYNGYRRGCRCDECRAGAAEASRQYAAKVKLRDGISMRQKYRKRSNACCVDCGVLLVTGAGPRSKSGSVRCRPCGLEFRRRAAKGKRFRARAERVAIMAAQGTHGVGAWVQGTCLNCGEYFARKGAASAYCTSACRRLDKRHSAFITKARRFAIYERDHWTCQICSEPVDPTLHYLDDWAASLDHITPRSLGGSHEESNLRLAHRWCNSVRGDLSRYTDADLAAA